MASIPELMDGHITLEVECLDRLYLNGYIGRLATPGGLVMFMRDQLGKPIPSPVVLGQITEKFRKEVKALADQGQIPIHPFTHKEKKDPIANRFRRERGTRDGIVFIGVAQEKTKAFNGRRSTDNSSSTVTRRSTSTTTTSISTTKSSVRFSSRYAATRLGESSSA